MLYLDTSAILAAVVEGPARSMVIEALAMDLAAVTAASTLAEALAAVDRLTDEAVLRAALEDELRRLWDHLYVVEIGPALLEEAAALCRLHPLRLAHALHLTAAGRLPAPTSYVTLDPAQIPVALALEFDLISL